MKLNSSVQINFFVGNMKLFFMNVLKFYQRSFAFCCQGILGFIMNNFYQICQNKSMDVFWFTNKNKIENKSRI
jgi:hypothetical protein